MRTERKPNHGVSGKNPDDSLTIEHFSVTHNGPEFKIKLTMPRAHDGQDVIVTATTEGIDE